jgi:virginiamycin B lyase
VLAFSAASATAAPTIKEFEIPTKDLAPSGITPGPDGNLWFAFTGKEGVGRSTPSGTISEFKTGFTGTSQGIAAGADGNLWFTEPKANKIGRITTLGVLTEYPAEGEPSEITAGSDGNLWFTEPAKAGAIGRINPSTGKVSEFSVGLTPNSKPQGITAGPDGALWFSEVANPAAIGRITVTGTITEYRTGLTTNSQPTGITAGPDGALWFTEVAGPGAIGRITTTGTLTEYTAGLTPNSKPTGITTADDGNLYFTEAAGPGRIGTITPAGLISELATPTNNSQPAGITTGPDGNLWFTEVGNHGWIATMTVAPAVTSPTVTSVTEQGATLNAGVTPNSQATTYHFEYGPTTAYGSQSSPASAGAGAGASPVATPVSGLTAGSAYHFRAVASNATGTSYGPDSTFTTHTPPAAFTQPATGVTTMGAMLNGAANPNGQATTYHFDWGTSTAYGSQLPLTDASVGSDTSEHLLAQSLSGLTADTPYHFRLVATNCGGCAEGTTYGPDQTFTTAPAPTAISGGAEGVGLSAATVTGSVNPQGAMTTYHVDWGESSAYGSQSPVADAAVGSDSIQHTVAQSLTGLTPGLAYHYRIVATNCGGCLAGTSYGGDMTFATERLPLAFPAPLGTAGSNTGVALQAPFHLSPPALGRTAVVSVLSGSVTVRIPGSSTLQPLAAAGDIPMGSVVDAELGVVLLTTALDRLGHLQSATLWGGTFVIGQTATRGGMTTFTLAGPLSCPGRARRASLLAAAARASSRRPSRSLWAKDKHGHFSTRGQNSVATVRGTYWETVDRCNGTLTVVKNGAVGVRDLRRRRTVLVKAGHSYLARV